MPDITKIALRHIMGYTYDINYHMQGGPKNGTIILYVLTVQNINGLSKLFHYQNQEKMSNKTITEDPTTPQVCHYTTL